MCGRTFMRNFMFGLTTCLDVARLNAANKMAIITISWIVSHMRLFVWS